MLAKSYLLCSFGCMRRIVLQSPCALKEPRWAGQHRCQASVSARWDTTCTGDTYLVEHTGIQCDTAARRLEYLHGARAENGFMKPLESNSIQRQPIQPSLILFDLRAGPKDRLHCHVVLP